VHLKFSFLSEELALTYTLLSSIIVSSMVISIVSALGFFVCFFLVCENSSKSRIWKFGKVHMTIILKLHLIRFYELEIHCKRKREYYFQYKSEHGEAGPVVFEPKIDKVSKIT